MAKISLSQSTTTISGADDKPRLEAHCPGSKKRVAPLGGGMVASPPPSAQGGGEGVYPHSFERLGAQLGFHVTPVLYDPSTRGGTTPRTVTTQVVCGPKSRYTVDMRYTVFVGPGQIKSATATCPGKRRVFGGGFQRTNFVSRGGNYVTSSYASSAKSWTVTGSAFGSFGGELTAIAYCRSSGKPLITPVSAQTTFDRGELGQAETPSCPAGQSMIFGGHATFPEASSLFADGYFTPGGTWIASAFNRSGPETTLTAYGYCHSNRFPRARKETNPFQSVEAPGALKEAEKAVASERVLGNGCYPGPPELAAAIARRTKHKTDVARSHSGVNRPGVVYVLSNGASCDLVRLSLRKSGSVYTINTATGRVKAKG